MTAAAKTLPGALLPALLLALLTTASLAAQERSPGVQNDGAPLPEAPRSELVQQEEQEGVTPGGAFLRSLIVPGWGHAATGSYTRGGFYFLAQAGTTWMLVRTSSTRGTAREIRDLRLETAELRFLAEGLPPDSARIQADADPGVADAQALVDSRSQQFEDWAAFGLFMLLIGAADAFVAGHLQDFPAPLSIRALPAGGAGAVGARATPGSRVQPASGSLGVPGGVEFQLSIPWQGPGGGGRKGAR